MFQFCSSQSFSSFPSSSCGSTLSCSSSWAVSTPSSSSQSPWDLWSPTSCSSRHFLSESGENYSRFSKYIFLSNKNIFRIFKNRTIANLKQLVRTFCLFLICVKADNYFWSHIIWQFLHFLTFTFEYFWDQLRNYDILGIIYNASILLSKLHHISSHNKPGNKYQIKMDFNKVFCF